MTKTEEINTLLNRLRHVQHGNLYPLDILERGVVMEALALLLSARSGYPTVAPQERGSDDENAGVPVIEDKQ